MTASLGIICCVAFLDVSRTKNGWKIFQTLTPSPTRFVFSLDKAPRPSISIVICPKENIFFQETFPEGSPKNVFFGKGYNSDIS